MQKVLIVCLLAITTAHSARLLNAVAELPDVEKDALPTEVISTEEEVTSTEGEVISTEEETIPDFEDSWSDEGDDDLDGHCKKRTVECRLRNLHGRHPHNLCIVEDGTVSTKKTVDSDATTEDCDRLQTPLLDNGRRAMVSCRTGLYLAANSSSGELYAVAECPSDDLERDCFWEEEKVDSGLLYRHASTKKLLAISKEGVASVVRKKKIIPRILFEWHHCRYVTGGV